MSNNQNGNNNQSQNRQAATQEAAPREFTVAGQTFASPAEFLAFHEQTQSIAKGIRLTDAGGTTAEVLATMVEKDKDKSLKERLSEASDKVTSLTVKDLAIGLGVGALVAGVAYGGYRAYDHFMNDDAGLSANFFDGMEGGLS